MEDEEEHDLSLKIILLGDAGVGKTNILSRFIVDDFSMETPSTVSMEFGRKVEEIDGKKVKLQIWDTAGQERYRAVTKNYIKGSKGAFIVYDISKSESFKNIDDWFNDIKENGDADCVIEIIGNKSDLEESRDVTEEEGRNKANELKTLFNETSALRGDNIEEAFKSLIKAIISNSEKNVPSGETEETAKEKVDLPPVSLATPEEPKKDGKPASKKKKKCC